MFRRRWSGLPPDHDFPCNLKDLGYFVNDEDEIRNRENPDFYFKYFLTKNTRVNDRQRFAFNTAIEDIVHRRIEDEGLERIRLPFGISTKDPHVPIYASPDLTSKSRVVVIFGETCQMLGVLALRVLNGPGGINKGSMVSIIRELKRQPSSKDDPSPPGIILANTGQLWWWPEGKRALETCRRDAVPLPSAVHNRREHYAKLNDIPRNENTLKHVKYMFEEVIPSLVGEDSKAKVDVIGISDGAEAVEEFLNEDANWEKHGAKLHAMVILGGYFHSNDLTCQGFKTFLERHTRAYTNDTIPINTPLSTHLGNPKSANFTHYGCPVYSSAAELHTELILIQAKDAILGWLTEVALTPGYVNDPSIDVMDPPQMMWEENGGDGERKEGEKSWVKGNWDKVPESAKPSVSFVDSEEFEKERRFVRCWKEFEETGEYVKPDLSDDE